MVFRDADMKGLALGALAARCRRARGRGGRGAEATDETAVLVATRDKLTAQWRTQTINNGLSESMAAVEVVCAVAIETLFCALTAPGTLQPIVTKDFDTVGRLEILFSYILLLGLTRHAQYVVRRVWDWRFLALAHALARALAAEGGGARPPMIAGGESRRAKHGAHIDLFSTTHFNPWVFHRSYLKRHDKYFHAVIVYVLCKAIATTASLHNGHQSGPMNE